MTGNRKVKGPFILRHIIWRESRPEAPALTKPLAGRSRGNSWRFPRSDFFLGRFFHLQAQACEQLIDAEAVKQGVEDIKYQHDGE